MQKTRPYLKAKDYMALNMKKDVPIFWHKRAIKSIRMCRLRTRDPKYTITFQDDSATIIDGTERLYFDAG